MAYIPKTYDSSVAAVASGTKVLKMAFGDIRSLLLYLKFLKALTSDKGHDTQWQELHLTELRLTAPWPKVK